MALLSDFVDKVAGLRFDQLLEFDEGDVSSSVGILCTTWPKLRTCALSKVGLGGGIQIRCALR